MYKKGGYYIYHLWTWWVVCQEVMYGLSGIRKHVGYWSRGRPREVDLRSTIQCIEKGRYGNTLQKKMHNQEPALNGEYNHLKPY